MAETNDTSGMIYQNLIDAGCGKQVTDECMEFVKTGSYAKMLPVLSQVRRTLLEKVHFRQKQIDCLDYLVYKIKKQNF